MSAYFYVERGDWGEGNDAHYASINVAIETFIISTGASASDAIDYIWNDGDCAGRIRYWCSSRAQQRAHKRYIMRHS